MSKQLETAYDQKQVIDVEFSAFVKETINKWGVKGLSLVVVRPDAEVEYGSWGVKSEEGDEVTPEVSKYSLEVSVKHSHLIIMVDSFRSSFLFKSICGYCSGNLDR